MKIPKESHIPLLTVRMEYGGVVPESGGILEIKSMTIEILEGNVRIKNGRDDRIETLGPKSTFMVKPQLRVYST